MSQALPPAAQAIGPQDRGEPNFRGADNLDYTGNDPGDNSWNAPPPLEARVEQLIRVHNRHTPGRNYDDPLTYYDISLIADIVKLVREGEQ